MNPRRSIAAAVRYQLSVAAVALATCLVTGPSAEAQKKKPSNQKPASAKPAKINLPESVRRKPGKIMQVAAVSPSTRSQVVGAASRLDGYVETKLLDQNLEPNRMAEDEVFLRRVYLDVAGRIPTLGEATDFLESADPNKREELIDILLSSPDYVSNMYNFWADTLRLVERPQPNIVADP